MLQLQLDTFPRSFIIQQLLLVNEMENYELSVAEKYIILCERSLVFFLCDNVNSISGYQTSIIEDR